MSYEASDRGVDQSLFVSNADGSEQRQLANVGSSQFSRVQWSSDGKRLAFLANVVNEVQLHIFNVDGTSSIAAPLQGTLQDVFLEWLP